MHGGKRQGAGRRKGSNGEKTIARAMRVEETLAAVDAALPNAFRGDAHALLVSVYKDTSHPWPLRIDAAKAAVGYEKPKLAAVEHSGDKDNPIHTKTVVEQRIIDAAPDTRTSDTDERSEETRPTH